MLNTIWITLLVSVIFLCPVYKLNKYFWVGDEKEEKLINTLTSFSINRGFSNLAPLTFEATVLCRGGCPVHCRMLSSIEDSNPLDTWISPQHQQHLQIMPSFFSRGQLPSSAPVTITTLNVWPQTRSTSCFARQSYSSQSTLPLSQVTIPQGGLLLKPPTI